MLNSKKVDKESLMPEDSQPENGQKQGVKRFFENFFPLSDVQYHKLDENAISPVLRRIIQLAICVSLLWLAIDNIPYVFTILRLPICSSQRVAIIIAPLVIGLCNLFLHYLLNATDVQKKICACIIIVLLIAMQVVSSFYYHKHGLGTFMALYNMMPRTN